MMNVWQRIDAIIRDLVPFLTALCLIILSLIPLGVAGGGAVTPNLSLAAVFYWRMTRFDLMPAFAAFGLGLFQDIVADAPLGLHALIYLLLSEILSNRHLSMFKESFLSLWAGFCVVVINVEGIIWLLYSLLHLTYMSIEVHMVRVLVTIFMFPFIVWIFSIMRRYIIR